MNRDDETNPSAEQGMPSLDSLLAYRGHLDGDAFAHSVARRATRAKRHRTWILGGAAVASAAMVAVIAPPQFTFFHAFLVPLQHASHSAGAVPVGGLWLMSFILILMASTSKTIDSF